MEQNEDAKREAAEKLAAEYQAKVMNELMKMLTVTGTIHFPTNEKETRPDPRLN